MTEAPIEEFVAMLRESIEATQDDLVREDIWNG